MLMATNFETNFKEIFGEPVKTPSLSPPVSEMCLILVQSPQEQLARDSLRRRGVGIWWPNYQRIITKKDAQTGKRYQRVIRVGVLPGVILSPAAIGTQFFDALDHAPGVMGVAQKPNGHWLLLSDLDIVLIHKIEHGLNRPEPAKSVHKFKAGDRVTFTDDIYRRLPPGIVVKCEANGVIAVEANFMGCNREIRVRADQIELA